MKKILIALVGLGFISTLCFAADMPNTAASEPAKTAEAKVAKTEMKAETKETKEEAAKKATKKAAKKGKKVNKKKSAKSEKAE